MFNNQPIGNLLADIQKEFYKPKREIISKELKELIFKKQCGKCADCDEDLKDNFELDHIQPVSGGGTNERENLEYLCKACHVEKSKEEHAEYIKRDNISSSLNLQAAEILQSNFSRRVAFSHYLDNRTEFDERFIQAIDNNKNRRNIILTSEYNYPQFSVLDNWEPFNGKIEDGIYYVETDNYFPFHKNGEYSRPLVEYGLNCGIITLENIKYQFIPSSIIKNDYFRNFIHYLIELFEEFGKDKLLSILGLVY